MSSGFLFTHVSLVFMRIADNNMRSYLLVIDLTDNGTRFSLASFPSMICLYKVNLLDLVLKSISHYLSISNNHCSS